MADYSQGPIAGAPPAQLGYNTANTTTRSSNPDNAFLSNVRPPYRPWLKFLPPLILVFTVGVIAMIAYAVHVLENGSQGLGFNLFAGAWTTIVGTYFVLAFWAMPHIHYRWIIFILSVLSCIWWLTAFAYLASNTRDSYKAINLLEQYTSYTTNYGGYDLSGYGFRKRDSGAMELAKRQSSSQILYYATHLSTVKKAVAVMAGASAIGAIIWLIFCVFTVLYAIAIFSNSSHQPAGVTPVVPAVAGQEPKIETSAHVQPMYPPPVAANVNTGFAPVRPENTFSSIPTYNTVDPRDPRMAPGAEFLTPPPPGTGYPNSQFGAYEADRNYTVSPLSVTEMPASQPPNFVEMPAPQR